MSTLADIKLSITELPENEALSLIMESRKSRLTYRKPRKKKDGWYKKLSKFSVEEYPDLVALLREYQENKLKEFQDGQGQREQVHQDQ